MLASEVMDRAAALLNDNDQSLYNYGVQIPFLNMALDELEEILEANNVGVTNSTSAIIPITTAMFDIGGSTGPALPTGLVEIQQLFERPTGTNQDFLPMTRVEFLPQYIVLMSDLIYWSWEEQIIKFKGCLTNTDVKIEFVKTAITPVTTVNSAINIINSKSFLAYRTAALCAANIGENQSRENDLNVNATLALDRMLGINIKGRQSILIRRRPFMATYKARGIV